MTEPLQKVSSTTARPSTSSDSEVTSAPAQAGLSRESLEEEVGQVIGTLSSWWGGVKKQSASALSNIRADLDKTVIQAQTDFEQLRTAKVEVVRKNPEQYAAEQEAERALNGATSGTILDRITSSTSQIQHNLQTTIQSTLAAATATDVSQLAESLHLNTAKQNIQESVKQAEKIAEGYLQRGDELRKNAERWMSEAVKVVPPEEQAAGSSGVSWDGSDWYAIVTQPAKSQSMPQPKQSTSQRALAGSRKDALLARLREDKELVLVDPASPDTPLEQRQRFERWIADKWSAQKENVISAEGAMVGTVRMAVVPEHMTDEEFWQRYLYIRDTIFEEDEKRQELLKATEAVTRADEFTWDDEPEEAPPKPMPQPSASTSPRNSSEESYDVVSEQAKEQLEKDDKAGKRAAKGERTDDEDSDWE